MGKTSASDLVGLLTSVERLAMSSLTVDEKVMVLDDSRWTSHQRNFVRTV